MRERGLPRPRTAQDVVEWQLRHGTCVSEQTGSNGRQGSPNKGDDVKKSTSAPLIHNRATGQAPIENWQAKEELRAPFGLSTGPGKPDAISCKITFALY